MDFVLPQDLMKSRNLEWPVIWDYMTFMWRHRNMDTIVGTFGTQGDKTVLLKRTQ